MLKIFHMNDDARYVPTKYDSVFWIDVERIQPNPYQPRKDFNEASLTSLAESIRQYGVLQPLVVSRTDVEKPEGGLESVYELIAGERRLRGEQDRRPETDTRGHSPRRAISRSLNLPSLRISREKI